MTKHPSNLLKFDSVDSLVSAMRVNNYFLDDWAHYPGALQDLVDGDSGTNVVALIPGPQVSEIRSHPQIMRCHLQLPHCAPGFYLVDVDNQLARKLVIGLTEARLDPNKTNGDQPVNAETVEALSEDELVERARAGEEVPTPAVTPAEDCEPAEWPDPEIPGDGL